MTNPVYDLNSASWFKIYEDYRTWNDDAIVAIPIADWVAGQTGAELLAVLTTSLTGGDNWRFGGFISLGFDTGIEDPAAATAESSQSFRLTLGRIKLIEVQKFAPQYSIKMSVPSWFPDVTTKIWAYVGSKTYPEIELLNQINANTQP